MRHSRIALFAALSAAALGTVSSSLYAGSMGYYIGIQGGYTATNASDLPESDVLPDFTQVAATIPGSSVMVNNSSVTISSLGVNSIDVTSFVNKTKDNVFTGRLFFGYQFYSNLAIELGYTNFRSTSLSYDASLNAATTLSLDNSAPMPATLAVESDSRHDSMQQDAIDLVFKGILPMNYGIDLFAKVGGVWLYTRTQTDITISGISSITINGTASQINPPAAYTITTKKRSGKVYPTVTVGIDYYFIPDMALELGLTRITGNAGGSSNNMDFVSAGVFYNIKAL
ncbi:hypothetical protein AQUSIP_09230 [Aquicella siphonis]|uniref:Outer membrane protein OmpA-like transmembrane domain-containing protein n=1 Tax=Aquicella siphonis TaxID=254247 RepID=A0A5E4PH03_9COXI|nr:hypothetical protein [Aquicella siphonis]VVC75633.1 hypothetical protein AQUSIP_09230 [Aquicella siphonis]